MDMLLARKFSAEILFYDVTVFTNFLSIPLNHSVAISIDIAFSISLTFLCFRNAISFEYLVMTIAISERTMPFITSLNDTDTWRVLSSPLLVVSRAKVSGKRIPFTMFNGTFFDSPHGSKD